MCGTTLSTGIEPSERDGITAAPSLPPALSRSPSRSKPLLAHSSSALELPLRPQLKFLHRSGQSFLLLRESGTLGRQNMTDGSRPEIDLSALPHSEVVSRTHAHVYWDQDQQRYMIIDDSRNGSYLNGVLMARGAPYPLNLDDELQIGQDQLICLTVDISHAEPHSIYLEKAS